MMRSVLAVGFGLLLVAPSALAKQGQIEQVGEAMIKQGDVVAAKKAAIADGLKKCVEQVIGVTITSKFTADQKEVVKNNESEFYSKVRDTLVQESEGFIEKHEVLDEGRRDDVYWVRVRAMVFESKIRAEVQKLADLIAAAGNPKLMLVVQEVYVSPEGTRRLAAESLVGANIEKELLARGFELRGQRAARKVADGDVAAYDQWLDDVGGASSLARKQGADILIAGRIEILDKGVIEDAGAFSALKGQRRVELSSVVRGLNAASGEVFSSKPVQMSSVGVSLERAVQRAIKGRGKNLVAQLFGHLLEDLKESFRKTAEQGQSYVVELGGVKSFRKQAKVFVKALRDLDGVEEAKQVGFAKGRLTVDLRCKCTVGELQERIFAAADEIKNLSSIDVDSVAGKKLMLKL